QYWIKAMRAFIFLVVMTTFAACLLAPAHADRDAYNKQYLAFNELKAQVAQELARVNTMKPVPKADTGLCQAALTLMTHGSVLWMNPEPSCFENKTQMDDFAGSIHTLCTDAWKIAQAFCSDAEMQRR